MTKKTTRARYTLEFKQEAVRLVEGGQSIAAAARTLGVVEQTLHNWVKAHRQAKLKGADSKPVSAEQMEISRLAGVNYPGRRVACLAPMSRPGSTLMSAKARGGSRYQGSREPKSSRVITPLRPAIPSRAPSMQSSGGTPLVCRHATFSKDPAPTQQAAHGSRPRPTGQ